MEAGVILASHLIERDHWLRQGAGKLPGNGHPPRRAGGPSKLALLTMDAKFRSCQERFSTEAKSFQTASARSWRRQADEPSQFSRVFPVENGRVPAKAVENLVGIGTSH